MSEVAEDQLAEERRQTAGGEHLEPEPEGDEEQEGELEQEGEPEPEPEPEATLDMEGAFKKLDREATRHEKRVREIMGEDAEILEECPLCQVPGFVFPFVEGTPDAELRKLAVAAYFGAAEPDYRPHPAEMTCEMCDGYGQLANGSKLETHRLSPCPTCGATGHHLKPTAPGQPGYMPVPGELVQQPANGAEGQAAPDVWQRPPGHPHYGIPPALVTG